MKPAEFSAGYNEDKHIGHQLTPHDEYIGQIDMLLGHHTRIEEWHEQDGCPHQEVEDIFADSRFIDIVSHISKDMKKLRII